MEKAFETSISNSNEGAKGIPNEIIYLPEVIQVAEDVNEIKNSLSTAVLIEKAMEHIPTKSLLATHNLNRKEGKYKAIDEFMRKALPDEAFESKKEDAGNSENSIEGNII